MDNNPSPGNKQGGLTTILEKSLGAAAKGGSTPLTAVYQYAETVTEPGFVFMDTPGYDPVSATGQIAGGAQVVVFTTGRGSAFGSKPAPTIKVATNDRLFAQMPDDMDINCGDIVSAGVSIEAKGREILDRVLARRLGREDQERGARPRRQRVRPLAGRRGDVTADVARPAHPRPLRHRAADRPGADGRRGARRHGGRGRRGRRPRLAARRAARRRGVPHPVRHHPPADRPADQRQLLLPSPARARPRARGRVEGAGSRPTTASSASTRRRRPRPATARRSTPPSARSSRSCARRSSASTSACPTPPSSTGCAPPGRRSSPRRPPSTRRSGSRSAGCDAIIAQGSRPAATAACSSTDRVEAQVGTLALVPQVVDAVAVPVIAAGGIADGRGHRRRLRARGRRGADRHRLPLLPRGDHRRPASQGAARPRPARDGADQRLHRPPGPRHRQPRRARGRADVAATRPPSRSPAARWRRCARPPSRPARTTSCRSGPASPRRSAATLPAAELTRPLAAEALVRRLGRTATDDLPERQANSLSSRRSIQ